MCNLTEGCLKTWLGPGGEEVPPVWVDRAGAKIALQETYSRNSKGSLGLVLERVRPSLWSE